MLPCPTKRSINKYMTKKTPNSIRRYKIIGARRLSNYWWASIIFLGSVGFLITGFSSYFNFQFFLFGSDFIQFFPQGLVMSFYGLIGFWFSVYLWMTILWSVGSGFNEFDNFQKKVRIFRWGFPGKNRRINLCYRFDQIEAIRIEIKQGLNPKRNIYLQIRGKREIPLTRIGQPLTYEQIEQQAADLAKFLDVSLLF